LEGTLPRIISVKLKSIACTENGFGGTVQISGNTFGSTFQNLDLTGLRDTRTIFPFPAGPVAIEEGETKSITMDDVRFSLKTTNEPPELSPKVLKVVGDLTNGLGSNSFLVRWDDFSLPHAPSPAEDPEHPAEFKLDYTTANLAITLTFIVWVAQVF
jgi:hypothetical protein